MVDVETGKKTPEQLERLLDELVEGIKNAKTPEEVELLEKKAKIVEDLIKAYEGDKDLEQVGKLVEKLGDVMENLIGPLKDLLAELYSPDRIEAMGRSVAEFYKTLVEAGMDKEEATKLTKEYMDSINIVKKLMESLGSVMGHGKEQGNWWMKMVGQTPKKPGNDGEEGA
ncbi:hypothetical protein [Pyrococcus yayanosii]|uniref:Uncharacterized protein n=1 Tax=Pyrococcus yayanosii (strain CH1 / JCM 16557) TaxID=529709 RepID=F8AG60_PYRYC|nr:hypothetical protein [Pyrococcus yayanosii]AEH23896.1 hypothetical protein PYCH_01940 [Pyrococcus yayanosii CH1]